MCLILIKPKSVILPKKLFKNVFEKNKDGFGFMLLDKHKNIITYKSNSKFWEEHYEAFAEFNTNEYEVGLHWRYKTQGDVCLENTHPFEVKKNEIYLMHNGTIGGLELKNNKSDTYTFVETVLNPYIDTLKKPKEILKNEINKFILGKIVGELNKLLFLTKEGFVRVNTFFITDEDYIPEMQNIIFSNTYAWDNQFWYKKAYQNDINDEYVTTKKKDIPSTIENYSYNNQNYHRRYHKPDKPTPTLTLPPPPPTQKLQTKQNKDYTVVTLERKKENTYPHESCLTNILHITTYHLYEPNDSVIVVNNTKEKEENKEKTTEKPVLLLPKQNNNIIH